MVVSKSFYQCAPYPECLPTATSSSIARSSTGSTRIMALRKRFRARNISYLSPSNCANQDTILQPTCQIGERAQCRDIVARSWNCVGRKLRPKS